MQSSGTERSLKARALTAGPAAFSSFGIREKCKHVVVSGLYHTGLLQIARCLERGHELRMADSRLPKLQPFSGPKFGILCYHRIGTAGVPLFSHLKPSSFEAQMKYIRKHYRVVSLAQLCLELKEQRSVAPTLAVTFDDGYRDLYTYAFPVLRKYQIPATIYLIGRCMETGEAPWYDRVFSALQASARGSVELQLDSARRFNLSSAQARVRVGWEIVSYLRTISNRRRREWCEVFESVLQVPEAELRDRMLDWPQVRALHRAGVSFGAHTETHPAVSCLEPEYLGEELLGSRQTLEDGLQSSVLDFAYPFGKAEDCSVAAEYVLIANGFRSAVTTVNGCNTGSANVYRLRRLQVGDNVSLPMFAFGLSRMFLDCASDSGSPEFRIPVQGAVSSMTNHGTYHA